MSRRSIRIIVVIIILADVLLCGLIGVLWGYDAIESGYEFIAPERGLSEQDRANTFVPLTITALYIPYFKIDNQWPEATTTTNAIETAEAQITEISITTLTAAAVTATPSPDLATYQIPLTQTAVHADYVGTIAALDNMATGTAGALIAATPEASPIPAN